MTIHPKDTAGTAAMLFAVVWDVLVDLLGSAATAALVQRASMRAGAHRRALGALRIRREGFDYLYAVPDAWTQATEDAASSAIEDLRSLAHELSPLLIELTGPVVIRRLNRMPELESCAILFGPDPEKVP